MQEIGDVLEISGKAFIWDADQADWKEPLERWSLVSLIVDAVQTIEWPESDLQLSAGTGFTFRPLLMLTVLTYCYATGVNRSTEIELATRQDEILRYFCQGSYPTRFEIQNFRSSHLELVRQSLAQVLRMARECPATGSICFSGRRLYHASMPSEFELAREAEARIQQVISLDEPTAVAPAVSVAKGGPRPGWAGESTRFHQEFWRPSSIRRGSKSSVQRWWRPSRRNPSRLV